MSKTYSVALLETMGMPEEMIYIFESLKAEENWLGLSVNMSLFSDWLPVTFAAYYDSVPDHERYNFLIGLYTNGGDRVGSIRKEMRNARKYGSPVLPPDLGDIITVYRAGDESINKAPYRLSWTTDLEKAKWFMDYSGIRKGTDMHLYVGEISRDKVIAYYDGRDEKEIIQYRNVKNIKEIGFMTYEEIVGRYVKSRKEMEKS